MQIIDLQMVHKELNISYIPQYIVVVNMQLLIYCTLQPVKTPTRIISALNAYYRHITKIMRIACVLKAYYFHKTVSQNQSKKKEH